MPRILIVDDDDDFRVLLERELNRASHDITIINNPHELTPKLTTEYFDVVLLDAHMPELEGCHLLREIRSNPEFNQTAIIMMTGDPDETLLEACFDAGAEDFVLKSTEGMGLNARIRAAVRKLALINELEEKSDSKLLFLSRMSHELRTPLNAIIGFSQILQSNSTPDVLGKLHKMPAIIHSSGLHLLKLVDDILDITRIEQGRFKINSRLCRLDDIVRESIESCGSDIESSTVTVTTDEINYKVFVDEIRLKQILTNLISNAIKYNRENGSIQISAKPIETDKGHHFIQIAVSDTGIGISEEELSQLFQPFSRLRYAVNNNIEGVGIGLALSRSIIEDMGGSLECESEIGLGTQFLLTTKAPTPTLNL